MKLLAWTVVILLVLLAGPLAVLASGRIDLSRHWRTASRDTAGIAPDAHTEKGAVIQVYGARTMGWHGAFGIHTWIAVKRSDETRYVTYQVLGWRVYRGSGAVDIREGVVPDVRWFGEVPELLADRRGPGVDALIDRIEQAVADYPWPGSYGVWPGPNSNTFVAYIARAVPELRVDLPPTAVGKDFLGATTFIAPTPSGTGWQVSLYGLLGVALAREEGVEINLLGLSIGVDVNDLALRLPGIGRVGLSRLNRSS